MALIPPSPQPEEQHSDESSTVEAQAKAAEIADWPQQLETLRALAQVVREESLSEVEVESGGVLFSLKAMSAGAQNVVYTAFPSVGAPVEYSNVGLAPPQSSLTASASTAPASPRAEKKAASGTPVVSPMVGLFYRAPSPNDPSFVEVGDRVEIGQTVGLIETMKVFNEITSETEGTVLEIKALAGALVETGDTLMTIG